VRCLPENGRDALTLEIGYYTTPDTSTGTPQETTVVASVTGKDARKRLRMELSSFAMAGSQSQPMEVDDEEGEVVELEDADTSGDMVELEGDEVL